MPKVAEEVDEGEILVKQVARAPLLGGVSKSTVSSMLEIEIRGGNYVIGVDKAQRMTRV